MTQRIENAINIFLDALNNGELKKGICTHCAVGNLVKKGMANSKGVINIVKEVGSLKTTYLEDLNGIKSKDWQHLFCTDSDGRQVLRSGTAHDIECGLEAISYTDFTEKELAKIENTFEKSCKIHSLYYANHTKEEIRADQVRGLEAVVKVMLEFEDSKEDVKEVFTNKAELIPI